ncbi:hypothetical protein SAY87_006031 [Trapa incisa]|uniref:Uncharacterized protein n=1 Tax=Trapa incisa TaxID=236973 RepID=A0AAN7KAW4_9MYRT|nr:hypothetical protein SAY87_006031 [Trapa incisa]
MASETLSWADQWGEGGIGAMPRDEGGDSYKREGKTTKKQSKDKAALKKIKKRTSNGFKWIKNLGTSFLYT